MTSAISSAADVAVAARDLGKTYRLYASPWDRLAEAITRRSRHQVHQALAGVSFELERGSGLGVIGQNGAGKTTLLKLLAGVLEPTAGSLEVRGTMSSILELGAGFHPDFTGRQNIRINAAMLGLGAERVAERTPSIVEFCELGDFLDRPVKQYSTGMVMRLAFSIATQVEPEVLIVDEALSVGDGYFQKKCTERLLELLDRGTTLLFCSHAMYYVDAFCQQAIWLDRGAVAAQGDAASVIERYEHFLRGRSADRAPSEPATDEVEAKPARLVDVTIAGGADRAVRAGEPLAIELEWEAEDPELPLHVGVGINRSDEIEVLTLSTRDLGLAPFSGHRRYRGSFEIPSLPLVKGEFVVYAFLLDERQLHVYDRRLLRPAFRIECGPYEFGLVTTAYRWLDRTIAPSGRDAEASAAKVPEQLVAPGR